jgi:hypothetical protein
VDFSSVLRGALCSFCVCCAVCLSVLVRAVCVLLYAGLTFPLDLSELLSSPLVSLHFLGRFFLSLYLSSPWSPCIFFDTFSSSCTSPLLELSALTTCHLLVSSSSRLYSYNASCCRRGRRIVWSVSALAFLSSCCLFTLMSLTHFAQLRWLLWRPTSSGSKLRLPRHWRRQSSARRRARRSKPPDGSAGRSCFARKRSRFAMRKLFCCSTSLVHLHHFLALSPSFAFTHRMLVFASLFCPLPSFNQLLVLVFPFRCHISCLNPQAVGGCLCPLQSLFLSITVASCFSSIHSFDPSSITLQSFSHSFALRRSTLVFHFSHCATIL